MSAWLSHCGDWRRILRAGACAALGACSAVTTAAADRALVMGIADYRGAPLEGVRKDMHTARDIARALGFKDADIITRQDGALTLAGLQQVLTSFVGTVAPGDRVFVYFSGHGSRFAGPGGGGRCVGALVSHDLKMLPREAFTALLRPALQRAAKSMVLLDTCHSAAVLPGTRDGSSGTTRPKFLRSGQGDDCSVPSNQPATRAQAPDNDSARDTPNHYLLAAAGETEVALDGGESHGGYATTAIAQCLALKAEALDKNRDGLVTFTELRACAQGRLDAKLQEERSRSSSFNFTGQTLTEQLGPGGDMLLPGFLIAPPAASGSATDARALLDSLYGARDANRSVQLQPARGEFRIGSDLLEFSLRSERRGHAFVFAVGASGNIDLLFPNRADADNRIEAGRPLTLPREGWRLRSRGPAGTTSLLAVVTDGAHWMGSTGTPLGIFNRIENRSDAVRELVRRLLSASACTDASAAPQRDFALEAESCMGRFGAARVDVVER